MGKVQTSKKVHPRIVDAQQRLSAAMQRGASQNALIIFRDELRMAQERFGRQLERA